MTTTRFNCQVSALIGLWGVKPQVMEGYVALAQTGSADDLEAYALRNGLNIPREDCERTVAEREARRDRKTPAKP